jgi:hypothetical protein
MISHGIVPGLFSTAKMKVRFALGNFLAVLMGSGTVDRSAPELSRTWMEIYIAFASHYSVKHYV